MVCHIYAYIEIKKENKWINLIEYIAKYSKNKNEKKAWYMGDIWLKRNYPLFGLISKGVKNNYYYSLEPKGMPSNISPTIKRILNAWNSEAHSCSYLTIIELKELATTLLLLSMTTDIYLQLKGLREILANFDESKGINQRIVFWFVN